MVWWCSRHPRTSANEWIHIVRERENETLAKYASIDILKLFTVIIIINLGIIPLTEDLACW